MLLCLWRHIPCIICRGASKKVLINKTSLAHVSSFLFSPTSPIARSSTWNNGTHMALDCYRIHSNFPPQVNLSRVTKSSILPWAPPGRPCQHWHTIVSHWSTSVCSLSSSHCLVISPSLTTPLPVASQPYQHSSRETLRMKVFPQQSGGLQNGDRSFAPHYGLFFLEAISVYPYFVLSFFKISWKSGKVEIFLLQYFFWKIHKKFCWSETIPCFSKFFFFAQ